MKVFKPNKKTNKVNYTVVFKFSHIYLDCQFVANLLSKVKTSGIFFQIFVACLERINWLIDFFDKGTLKKKSYF